MSAPGAESPAHVVVSRRAIKDLHQIRGKSELGAIALALEATLAADPLPANADVNVLAGHPPWLRMRVGTYRILFRPLTEAELAAAGVGRQGTGYLVSRIVHRSELDLAVSRLG